MGHLKGNSRLLILGQIYRSKPVRRCGSGANFEPIGSGQRTSRGVRSSIRRGSPKKGILMTMNRLLLAMCTFGLVVGCTDKDEKTPSSSGTGGAVAMASGGSMGGAGSGQGGSAGAVPPLVVDAGPGASTDSLTSAVPPGMTAMMMITAKSGGTLSAGGGSLVVPGGVLTSDLALTLSVRAPSASDPGLANLIGNIYEFGPDGTTFAVPVTLTLPLANPVSADQKAVVAWLEESSGQWFPVVSTVTGDKVSGRISHFTRFAVLRLPKDEFCAYGGACGGSIDGTWKYTQACLKAEEKEAFKCGTSGVVMNRQEYSVAGTVTIGQGRYTADQMLQGSATLFYTPACMAVLREGGMPMADCATLQEAWRKQGSDPTKPPALWVCAGTVELGCSCKLTNAFTQKVTGTVSVDGTKVVFTQDGKAAAPKPDEFCVKGSALSVRTSSGEIFTAVKQ